MGLRVSDIVNDQIAKTKKKVDKAWQASCTPGYEKKLYMAEGSLRTLQSLTRKLRKARLIQ